MNEFVALGISAGLPAVVTIAGLWLAYRSHKRGFDEALRQQKHDVQLEKISDMPHKVQIILNDLINTNKTKNVPVDRFNNLLAEIFAYGSKDAIALVAGMQEINFKAAKNPKIMNSEHGNRLIAYYILLTCQMKYDLTGTEVNPDFWFRMKFKDYDDMKRKLAPLSNEIVKEHSLSDFLLIEASE